MTSNILAKSPLDAVTVYTWSFVFYFSTKNEINFTRGFDKFKEAGPKYEATQVTLGGNTITVTGVQKASLAVTKLHDNTVSNKWTIISVFVVQTRQDFNIW